MKPLFYDTSNLDRLATKMGLGEEILQENAARAVADFVKKQLKKKGLKEVRILVLAGGGNNGADGIAAARMLHQKYDCTILLLAGKPNKNAARQLQIASNFGLNAISDSAKMPSFSGFDIIIDAIFGSGLKGDFDPAIASVLERANDARAIKIAVDFPSGVKKDGTVIDGAFIADYTIAMGARKLGHLSDTAKDFVGKVKKADLGVSFLSFVKLGAPEWPLIINGQGGADAWMLGFKDMWLPERRIKSVNKSDFGHVFVACGQMQGAAVLAASSALKMGAGRVSILNLNGQKLPNLDPQIMQKSTLDGASVVVFGPGVGREFDLNGSPCLLKWLCEGHCIVDADAFYMPQIAQIAKNCAAVLTPHPKEFAALLKACKIGDFSVKDIQNNRFEFARNFSKIFPCTLVLKGANPITAQNGAIYIAPNGGPELAKGGSGDVLAGIIGAIFSQNSFMFLRNIAFSGVLAHQKAAKLCLKNGLAPYSITPADLISQLAKLHKKR